MFFIGIDIGGTTIKTGVVSGDFQIIRLKKLPTDNNFLQSITVEIEKTLSEFDIAGIGVGVAGLISKEGVVIESPNIRSLNRFPLKQYLSERFNLKISVENDATVATLAEAKLGLGRGLNRFILITLGTGIGGGIFCEGRVYEIPMEVGHTSINFQGKLCSCGNFGCLELYASGRAIRDSLIERIENGETTQARSLYEGNFYKITPEDVYKLALEGDNLSRQILKEAGKALGAGIANLINLFAPERVVLTGGLANAKNIYLETAIAEAKKRALKGLSERVEILQSELIDKGGVLGAVLLLRDL